MREYSRRWILGSAAAGAVTLVYSGLNLGVRELGRQKEEFSDLDRKLQDTLEIINSSPWLKDFQYLHIYANGILQNFTLGIAQVQDEIRLHIPSKRLIGKRTQQPKVFSTFDEAIYEAVIPLFQSEPRNGFYVELLVDGRRNLDVISEVPDIEEKMLALTTSLKPPQIMTNSEINTVNTIELQVFEKVSFRPSDNYISASINNGYAGLVLLAHGKEVGKLIPIIGINGTSVFRLVEGTSLTNSYFSEYNYFLDRLPPWGERLSGELLNLQDNVINDVNRAVTSLSTSVVQASR